MNSESDFPRNDELITINVAFDAMTHFLHAWWRRGGETSDDVAVILGGLDRTVFVGGGPADPAFWDDFLNAVDVASRGASQ